MSDLWWADYLQHLLALAIRRWAEGTVIGWTGTLRDLGQFAAQWPDIEPHDALSKYLVQRAAMGQQRSTLRGVISAVTMVEKLRRIPPTVRPKHWLMAKGAGVVSAAPRPTQVWAELTTLRTMAKGIRTSWDWLVLRFAVLSFVALLRIGEAASCRPRDLAFPSTISFDDKRADDWHTTRLVAWAEEWRAAMAAHPWVKECPTLVPIVGASYTLQDALWALLAGSGWERMGWHAWRRGGAAVRRAFGAALCSIAAAERRWDSEAEADRYASPPPGWTFFLPDDVPWPAARFTCRIAPVHAYQVWLLGALGPLASAGQEGGASDVRRGNSHDEGPGVRPGANVHEPIILGSTDDESPNTVARRAARQPKVSADKDVGPQPHQPNDRAHSAPAVRGDHARPLPPPTPAAPKEPRQGPLAAQDPQVSVRLATARCVQCSLDWNNHLDEAAEHIAKALRADMGAARDHLQLWWAEVLKWASDRPCGRQGRPSRTWRLPNRPSTSWRRASSHSMGLIHEVTRPIQGHGGTSGPRTWAGGLCASTAGCVGRVGGPGLRRSGNAGGGPAALEVSEGSRTPTDVAWPRLRRPCGWRGKCGSLRQVEERTQVRAHCQHVHVL